MTKSVKQICERCTTKLMICYCWKIGSWHLESLNHPGCHQFCLKSSICVKIDEKIKLWNRPSVVSLISDSWEYRKCNQSLKLLRNKTSWRYLKVKWKIFPRWFYLLSLRKFCLKCVSYENKNKSACSGAHE